MKKINHYIENNNTFAIIFIATVLVGGYFLFTLSPQSSARHTYEPNDDIVRVAEDDPSNALYINNNPRFEVLLGDKENPNKPTVTYISHTSNIPHSLTFSLADSNENATAPSLETVVSGDGDKKPRLIYRSALDNADINYRIDKGRGVKEEIILKVAPADNGGRDVGFVFDAEFSEGVQVEQGKDGVWYFTDSGGNYLFNFERPFMMDASGVRSEDVAIDIVPVEGVAEQRRRSFLGQWSDSETDGGESSVAGISTYQIILKANGPWLHDVARAYPVMIDPSVTHNADSDFTGQFNRVVDADATSSTQLEIGYQEHGLDPYTVLLIHGNEATGSTVITDTASSTRVITANGNASTTSAVTQLGLNNSLAFDGTGDYLSVPDSDDWNFGSGDFTIDMWIYATSFVDYESIFGQALSDGITPILAQVWADGHLHIYASTDGSSWDSISNADAGALTLNSWNHIAIVRDGNSIYGFIDGVKGSTSDVTGDTLYNSTNAFHIGDKGPSSAQDYYGYIDEIRITKGRALTTEEIKAAASRRPYAVYTSQVIDSTKTGTEWDTLSWTEGGVKTGDGETLFNDTSLVAQWNFNETSGTSASDSSANSHTGTLTNMTTSGQDDASGDGWTAENLRWGAGALMFDGADDYVSVADSTDWDVFADTTDYSIDFWMKMPDDTNTQSLISQRESGTRLWYFHYSGAVGLRLQVLDTSTIIDLTGTTRLNDNAWHYVALTKTGTEYSIYVDGLKDVSVTDASTATYAADLRIGTLDPAVFGDYDGIIDSVRIYKGRALSAAEILSNYNVGNIEIQTRSGATSDPNDGTWEAWKPVTSETQIESMDSDSANWKATPIINDDYTKLLLHMNGTDTATTFPNSATTTHTVTANDNAQVDTAFSKFAGGSALFDGSGDYLSVPDSDDWDFTGDFTIDLWARWTSLGVDTLVANTEATATTKGFWWNYNNAGSLVFYFANDDGGSPWDISVVHAWTPSVDIWHHLAVVRDSGTITQYVDGISIGSTAGQSLSISSDNTLRVAADNLGTSDISGFLDELRISKGVARWTSNFTPPQRQYGSNTVATDESNIIMEGSGSMKLELGKSQIDGNTTALWHFEETGTTEGTTLYDATTNNNDATTTSNPAVVDGIFGKARLFDGVDDYLTVDDSADWDIVASSGDFTIDFWVNHTVTPTGSNGHYLGQYQDANNFWRLYYNGSSEGVKFYVDADGITDISLQGSGVGQLPDSWNYIAVVKNGNDYAIYTNGVQTATVTSSETANFTGQLEIGSATGQTNFTDGAIDELRIMKGYGMSADEVAEAYRLGANHKISRDITVQDFSASTTMPFWVAGDELGTYLEATIGESAWANYDSATTSTSTVLFIHGDEITDSTSIKDSSISSHTITANGNAKITASGKIGNAMTFDGTGDYLEIPDSDDWQFGGASGGDWTMSGWVLLSTLPSSNYKFMSQYVVDGTQWYFALVNNSGTYTWEFIVANGAGDIISSNKNLPSAPSVDTWYHVAIVRSGDDYSTWWNGAEIGTVNTDTDNMPNFAAPLAIGKINVQTYWNGNLDEIRILNTAMTQAEIRQAYEYGARAHPITIDFKASLQPSDLIADSSDTQFAITATTTGLSATTTGLYIGDKIIVKENVSGTEYLAQGTATTTNTTTGVVNVDQWDTGSTFPSGGYTQYATVFKWQREYMPLGGILDSHIDAVERITIRPTNGAGGRTVYLDDFRGSSGFLTASSSEAITSGDNRYFQYRTIYTTADTAVSPYMTAMTVNYTLSANSTPSVIGISGGGFLSF